jgi:hypothetical protein
MKGARIFRKSPRKAASLSGEDRVYFQAFARHIAGIGDDGIAFADAADDFQAVAEIAADF